MTASDLNTQGLDRAIRADRDLLSRKFSTQRMLDALALLAEQLAEQAMECWSHDPEDEILSTLRLARVGRHDDQGKGSDQPLAEELAQATVCATVAGEFFLRSQAIRQKGSEAIHPLEKGAAFDSVLACVLEPILDVDRCFSKRSAWQAAVADVVQEIRVLEIDKLYESMAALAGDRAPSLRLAEDLMAAGDTSRRQRRGVYFTPPAVARFLVRSVDSCLRDEFGLRSGLASEVTWGEMLGAAGSVPGQDGNSPFLRILDPAAGAGAFLVEAIDLIHARFLEENRASRSEEALASHWNQYVARHLLPCLTGFEILLPCYTMAHLHVIDALGKTGYRFEPSVRPCIEWVDTLHMLDQEEEPFGRFTVILGNPPFSGISQNSGRRIAKLLRGESGNHQTIANYFEVDGQPLGERKVWLHDDYVKFFRLGQWLIEQSGSGILALVSNHGWLDGASFRGMRRALMRTFPQIDVVDLHGNAKRAERLPGGRRDENIFGVGVGVSLAVMRRTPANRDIVDGESSVGRGDVWGESEAKLIELESSTIAEMATAEVAPTAPHFLFKKQDKRIWREWEQGIPLPEAMPISTTAPVTARDRFVVAMDREELIRRLEQFADLSIEDAFIRERYFQNTRSNKYRAGDTRSWKLTEARRRLAGEKNWQRHIHRCLYRPFDWRWVFWTDWMVDWPRTAVTDHLLATRENVALLTRRQMLPERPCCFFSVADTLVLDGVIRSDNRGSESLFPLFVVKEGSLQPNFSASLLAEVESATGMDYLSDAANSSPNQFGPHDLLHLIYAQFHSLTYRQRYAEPLTQEFPRLFLPSSPKLFRTLASLGRRLIEHHLLRVNECEENLFVADRPTQEAWRIESGYPRYDNKTGSVLINQTKRFDRICQSTWEFPVGGHQPLRKWLKDRRGRLLSEKEQGIYRKMIVALDQTQSLMKSIDTTIDSHGGWGKAGL